MIFTQKSKIIGGVKIKINNVTLEKVKSVKYLGLILDENLRWDNHIEYIKEKISPFIGAIFR